MWTAWQNLQITQASHLELIYQEVLYIYLVLLRLIRYCPYYLPQAHQITVAPGAMQHTVSAYAADSMQLTVLRWYKLTEQ